MITWCCSASVGSTGPNISPDISPPCSRTIGRPAPCVTGADCVYQRYLQAGRGDDLVAAGVTDPGSFTTFYWNEQFGSAGTILVITSVGGLGGAALYGVFRPKTVVAPDASSVTART